MGRKVAEFARNHADHTYVVTVLRTRTCDYSRLLMGVAIQYDRLDSTGTIFSLRFLADSPGYPVMELTVGRQH